MTTRRLSHWRAHTLALLVAGLCCDSEDSGGGCTADGNAIDPVGETPAERVEVDGIRIWRSRWDNPVIGAASYEMPTGSVEGYAIRQGSAWEYNKFDLELSVEDADPTHRLYTWPSFAGTYGDNETSFPFESYGMKLEPMDAGDPLSSISTATAIHDTWNNPELVLEDPLGNVEGRFQLDPNVGLVPLRVVVLFGDGLTTDTFAGPPLSSSWFSVHSARVLFDDLWQGSKFTNTMAPFFPDNVITEWIRRPGAGMIANDPVAGGGRHLQPDRVLDQCDVQFRMVSFHTCEVPPEILYDDACGSELQQTGHVNTVRSFVDNNCDVPTDTPKVIFLGSLGGSNCLQGTLNGAFFGDDVLITHLFAGKTTLPHELGHLVGLNHVDTTDNLMAPGQGVDLSADQCETANARARDFQADFWGPSQ